jgi:hypothetical protein
MQRAIVLIPVAPGMGYVANVFPIIAQMMNYQHVFLIKKLSEPITGQWGIL